MKSNIPKVLHKVLGKTLIDRVLVSVNALNPFKNIIVTGHKSEKIISHFKNQKINFNIDFAFQEYQLGSANAVISAMNYVDSKFDGHVLVVCGDTPLLKACTLAKMFESHLESDNSVTVLTSILENPFGYGRILRGHSGSVIGIIEEKDATIAERAINEVNSGVYFFKYSILKKYISKIESHNVKNEYYLTDIVKIVNEAKAGKVNAYVVDNFIEMLGVNDRMNLSEVSKKLQEEINAKMMMSGVTINFPDTVYIEDNVLVGRDSVILPSTRLEGEVIVGENCLIGDSVIVDSSLGSNVVVNSSYVVDSIIGDNVKIGPFANIRPGSKISDNCKIGNFTEIKNSFIGFNTKVSHLSYIGDAELGKNVNVGAGTITCNYDGNKKSKTIIKNNSFIGSNSNFIAPVVIGEGAFIAAGSTIDKHVPDNSLGVARSRQLNKEGWGNKSDK